ncbi:DUF2285 domain-containing protein [Phyllobacterium sp. YR531]|uniref:DUF2285 domain-containing protein n=1 Tax=Phyllobacterium sp. YR531 TaxID=1144343 RepID=UPI00026FB261|nr:DUF2285 domain-containing protein [Phyllobacterium sp. YR531]EJN03494.1 hypothetical protein PMI41_02488 [Phyllobacterium sp. YR531]
MLILQGLPTWVAPAPAAEGEPLPTSQDVADTRIRVGEEVMRARSLGVNGAQPPAVAIVLLDESTPDRLDALARYWRGLRAPPAPPDPRVTPQRRQRLRQMLRAVDARLEQESYRAIATVLFPSHHIEAASWAGDALRETTIRLVRDGMKLIHGGYRDLLKRARKP